ncbi:MBL fold metallo-hydrolase [Leucobacter sp. W1038]|uniref:MBL fold metallo-hydrolase n=1 Tax=Leucobacter sp. W1038 TaxID=3438281 RepID=UPI003D98FBB2
MNNSGGAHLITLGTAAGPAIRSAESGIASAVVVDGAAYLVDFGLGITRRLHEAGLQGKDVVAGFLTHLHSDHMVELPALLLWNWGRQVSGFVEPVRFFGPGADPAHPGTAGFRQFVERSLDAYSYDLRIRELDEGRPPLRDLVEVAEITPPTGATEQDCEPFVIFEDSRVRVSAVLTPHPPVFPSYSFRFDTEYGSITFSGDTARSATLERLAADTDILVHEAVNLDYFRVRGADPAFLQHQELSHTSPADAGRVAEAARARTLVLSHLAGVADDEYWVSEARSTYSGTIARARSGDVFSLATESSAPQTSLAL